VAQHFGPAQRQLLEEAAGELYEDVAARGGVPADDPLLNAHPEAVDLLRDIGLLRFDRATDRYVVVDPFAVQSSVVAPLGLEGAQLIDESSRWAQAFSTLGQTYRRSPSTEDGPITRLRGDQIDRFIGEVVLSAQTELLTAQPQAGRSAAALRAAGDRDVAALKRGVSLRTIYQHAARRGRATRQYVARVIAEGAEVRTLDEFFNRLIVVDRELALIPAGDDLDTALAIRDVALVAYLVDIFERFWDRGRPFTNVASGTGTLSAIASEQRAMTIRMLIEGHSDATCAKRLGVSPRTYAAYVADLKAEYEAETRFQLGYRMGEQAAKAVRSSRSRKAAPKKTSPK
jgi:hypothetical protein